MVSLPNGENPRGLSGCWLLLTAPVGAPAGRGQVIRTRSPFNQSSACHFAERPFCKADLSTDQARGKSNVFSIVILGKHQQDGDLEIPHSLALPGDQPSTTAVPTSPLQSSALPIPIFLSVYLLYSHLITYSRAPGLVSGSQCLAHLPLL